MGSLGASWPTLVGSGVQPFWRRSLDDSHLAAEGQTPGEEGAEPGGRAGHRVVRQAQVSESKAPV